MRCPQHRDDAVEDDEGDEGEESAAGAGGDDCGQIMAGDCLSPATDFSLHHDVKNLQMHSTEK